MKKSGKLNAFFSLYFSKLRDICKAIDESALKASDYLQSHLSITYVSTWKKSFHIHIFGIIERIFFIEKSEIHPCIKAWLRTWTYNKIYRFRFFFIFPLFFFHQSDLFLWFPETKCDFFLLAEVFIRIKLTFFIIRFSAINNNRERAILELLVHHPYVCEKVHKKGRIINVSGR